MLRKTDVQNYEPNQLRAVQPAVPAFRKTEENC
jgi:hypothetical protein